MQLQDSPMVLHVPIQTSVSPCLYAPTQIVPARTDSTMMMWLQCVWLVSILILSADNLHMVISLIINE